MKKIFYSIVTLLFFIIWLSFWGNGFLPCFVGYELANEDIETYVPSYKKQYPYINYRKRWQELLRPLGKLHSEEINKEDSNCGAISIPLSPSPIEKPEESISQTVKKRGRCASIPTDHYCCPNKNCKGYGIFGPHPLHRIVGSGSYTTKIGKKRQMLQCQWCMVRFSETLGTVFFGLKTDPETVCRVLKALAEGLGIRATARVFDMKPESVLFLLRRAGQHSERVSEYMMRNLDVEQVQLDELWTFVKKKEKVLSEWEKLHTEYGDTWIWVAFDPINKLVLAMIIGDREEEQAVSLLDNLKARLVQGCSPLFTSDQLPHYAQAVLKVFGRWIQPKRKGSRGRFPNPYPVPIDGLDYATVHKEKKNGRVISVTKQVVYGKAKEILTRLNGFSVNTSFVERMNLTFRHLVSRLRRKGLTFSKKREYLEYHLHLATAYYHFVRQHGSLRRLLPEPVPTKGNGSPKKWEQRTPAMAAQLTDHIWTMEELLSFRVPPAA